MNPRVTKAIPEKDYTVHVWFTNGEEGIFDVKPYLGYEVFQPLKDEKMFNTVRPFIGTIQWANEADLCPDTIYLDSVKTKN
ncbi:MAG: DUF2442 domain-containing protein [Prevotellaceae bacterium]|jgi:hypothetical protein|nr:DUF2442 domain-containing protein [Prevotellaceae bacterium]